MMWKDVQKIVVGCCNSIVIVFVLFTFSNVFVKGGAATNKNKELLVLDYSFHQVDRTTNFMALLRVTYLSVQTLLF